MKKYITRTVKVQEITRLEADYINRSFTEIHETLVDAKEVPNDAHVDYETFVKVRMPIEKFYELGEKIEVGVQEQM